MSDGVDQAESHTEMATLANMLCWRIIDIITARLCLQVVIRQ